METITIVNGHTVGIFPHKKTRSAELELRFSAEGDALVVGIEGFFSNKERLINISNNVENVSLPDEQQTRRMVRSHFLKQGADKGQRWGQLYGLVGSVTGIAVGAVAGAIKGQVTSCNGKIPFKITYHDGSFLEAMCSVELFNEINASLRSPAKSKNELPVGVVKLAPAAIHVFDRTDEEVWQTHLEYSSTVREAADRLSKLSPRIVDEFRWLVLQNKDTSRTKEFEDASIKTVLGGAFVDDTSLQEAYTDLNFEDRRLGDELVRIIGIVGKPDDTQALIAKILSKHGEPSQQVKDEASRAIVQRRAVQSNSPDIDARFVVFGLLGALILTVIVAASMRAQVPAQPVTPSPTTSGVPPALNAASPHPSASLSPAAGAKTPGTGLILGGAAVRSVALAVPGAGQVYGAMNRDARVVLRARGDTRITVKGPDGQLLLNHDLKAGDIFQVPDMPGVTMATSNAGAVEVDLDGVALGRAGQEQQTVGGIDLDPVALAQRFTTR